MTLQHAGIREKNLKKKVFVLLQSTSDWEQWFYTSPEDNSQQVAGYVKHYRNLSFVTVKVRAILYVQWSLGFKTVLGFRCILRSVRLHVRRA